MRKEDLGPWCRDGKSYLGRKEDIFPKCLGNPVFAGNEPSVSCCSGGPLGNLGVCVLFTAHHPHSKCTQCALLFDQLLEVWGQGLAVQGGAFSAQEWKPDLERQGRELSVEVCWCCCVTLSQGVSLWVCRIKGQRF